MTTLNATLEIDGDQTIIRLDGELDMDAGPDLVVLSSVAAVRSDMRTLTIDLAGVAFMDSAGLAALVRARNLCDKHRAELRLEGVGPRVHRVLELTGLGEWFGTERPGS